MHQTCRDVCWRHIGAQMCQYLAGLACVLSITLLWSMSGCKREDSTASTRPAFTRPAARPLVATVSAGDYDVFVAINGIPWNVADHRGAAYGPCDLYMHKGANVVTCQSVVAKGAFPEPRPWTISVGRRESVSGGRAETLLDVSAEEGLFAEGTQTEITRELSLESACPFEELLDKVEPIGTVKGDTRREIETALSQIARSWEHGDTADLVKEFEVPTMLNGYYSGLSLEEARATVRHQFGQGQGGPPGSRTAVIGPWTLKVASRGVAVVAMEPSPAGAVLTMVSGSDGTRKIVTKARCLVFVKMDKNWQIWKVD